MLIYGSASQIKFEVKYKIRKLKMKILQDPENLYTKQQFKMQIHRN